MPAGIIRGISQNDAQFLHINAETGTFMRSGPTGVGATRWWGATAALNGMIYGIPFTATQVLVIDPCAHGRLNPNVPLSAFYNKF